VRNVSWIALYGSSGLEKCFLYKVWACLNTLLVLVQVLSSPSKWPKAPICTDMSTGSFWRELNVSESFLQ